MMMSNDDSKKIKPSKRIRRTIRLNSERIAELGLHLGTNNIKYIVKGTNDIETQGRIYLMEWIWAVVGKVWV